MNAPTNSSGLPTGELLGRYRTYEEAQRVVDHLAGAEGFDVKALSIVGNDLRSVEHIRSRLSYPRVALAGAAQGSLFGGFIAFIFFLFSPQAPLVELVAMIFLGAAVWMIAGIIGYAIRRGRRDFSSTQQLIATTYDVVCDFSQVGRARQLVRESGVVSLNASNDPTGRSTNLAGPQAHQPPAGMSGPAAPSSGAPASADRGDDAGTSAGTPARTGYETLPDGRPRYGARREDYEHPPRDSSRTQEDPPAHQETAPQESAQEKSAAPTGSAAGAEDQDSHSERPPRGEE
ncbi:general stress protein [Nesterenkonia alba]|uniref:general stress protein n=1 Tax=Nesterenkonia alba TaxID=515814 RepID=UPI0003FCFE34|nr:general stress protein [Nesterenkonia alba]